MKNHFIFSYAGNKRSECKDIYKYIADNLDLDNIETIIEPFCGSSAMSYYISTLHPGKFKYILNDNDSKLVQIYHIMKDETLFNNLVDKLEEMYNSTFDQTLTPEIQKTKYNLICKDADKNIESYIFIHKYYSIRAGLYPLDRCKKAFKREDFYKIPILKFLKDENVTICLGNGVKLLEDYKTNPNVLILLDPPYMLSFNDYYSNIKDKMSNNVYEYLYKNKISTFECKIMLILEKVWIIELLFEGHIKKTYSKLYQPTKKLTEHIIIANF